MDLVDSNSNEVVCVAASSAGALGGQAARREAVASAAAAVDAFLPQSASEVAAITSASTGTPF